MYVLVAGESLSGTSDEGNNFEVLSTLTGKPRPDPGLDCLICGIFDRRSMLLPLLLEAIEDLNMDVQRQVDF